MNHSHLKMNSLLMMFLSGFHKASVLVSSRPLYWLLEWELGRLGLLALVQELIHSLLMEEPGLNHSQKMEQEQGLSHSLGMEQGLGMALELVYSLGMGLGLGWKTSHTLEQVQE